MKKTYINPTTTVVDVKLQQMIAASPGAITLTIEDPSNPGDPAPTIDDPIDVGARQGNSWDDEGY